MYDLQHNIYSTNYGGESVYLLTSSVRIRHPPIRIRRRISVIFGYPYIRIRRITDIRDGLTDSIRIKRIIRIMADKSDFYYIILVKSVVLARIWLRLKKIFFQILCYTKVTQHNSGQHYEFGPIKIQRISEVILHGYPSFSDIRTYG